MPRIHTIHKFRLTRVAKLAYADHLGQAAGRSEAYLVLFCRLRQYVSERLE